MKGKKTFSSEWKDRLITFLGTLFEEKTTLFIKQLFKNCVPYLCLVLTKVKKEIISPGIGIKDGF